MSAGQYFQINLLKSLTKDTPFIPIGSVKPTYKYLIKEDSSQNAFLNFHIALLKYYQGVDFVHLLVGRIRLKTLSIPSKVNHHYLPFYLWRLCIRRSFNGPCQEWSSPPQRIMTIFLLSFRKDKLKPITIQIIDKWRIRKNEPSTPNPLLNSDSELISRRNATSWWTQQ